MNQLLVVRALLVRRSACILTLQDVFSKIHVSFIHQADVLPKKDAANLIPFMIARCGTKR